MSYYMDTINGKVYTEGEVLKMFCDDYAVNFNLYEDVDDFLCANYSKLEEFNLARIGDKLAEQLKEWQK